MLLEIHPHNPQERLLNKAISILEQDGVIIYPTDSSYAFGCSIQSKKAMKRIYQIKELDQKKPLTFICHDTTQFQQYTKGIPNQIFRRIQPHFPGPYTFIFEASKLVPKTMSSPRSTIGVRIPEAKIACMIAKLLDQPILSTSVPVDPDTNFHDPYLIHDEYQKLIDCTISVGEIFCRQSAMIDFSVTPAEIIREGDAPLDWLEIE